MNDKKSNIQLSDTTEDLFETAPCGYISFNADGKILRFNKTLLSLLKYEEEEFLKMKRFQDLFKIGGKIYFETHFFPLIKIQGFIREINFDLIKKDGTTFPALINVDEVKSSDASLIYRASILDITDRNKYETALLEAKEKAENASKAKAEFLSTISHEIRTPLNAILGIANLIQETPLNELQQEYSKILKLSSENLLDLVNNLLDLSKLEAQKVKLEKRVFNLKDLIKVLIQAFKIKASEKKITLKAELPNQLPYFLLGDPVKLSQILTNLLGNAVKFTRKGYVKLQLEILEQDEKQIQIKFIVQDTGIGIPEEKLDLIFEEFSQVSYDVNLEFGGTGLGLTISQKLLKMHGSKLSVVSEEGKGTTFSFVLNYSISKETIKKKTGPRFKNHFSSLNKKVLVVDDNQVNTFIAKQYLQNWKLESSTVDSGAKAIEEVQKNKYDLILMDLHMPHMNGYEAASKIRELKLEKQPVIIALSASGRGDINLKLERAGIDDYVPKPFDPLELQEALFKHFSAEKNDIPKKSNSEVKKQENGISRGAGPSFNISRYKALAGENPKILEQLVKNSINAIHLYQQEFSKVVATQNAEELQELIHKNITSLHYLQADKLQKEIQEYLDLLKSSKNIEELSQKANEIMEEFSAILKELKTTFT